MKASVLMAAALAAASVLFVSDAAFAQIVTGGGGDMVTGLNSLVSYAYQLGRPAAILGCMVVAVLLWFGHHTFTGLAFAVLATGLFFGSDRIISLFAGGGFGG